MPDGRVVQLWAGGAKSGPVVFVLPGCPDSRLIACTGDEAARRAGVRLIAVNRPGYGQSTPTTSGHLSVAADLIAIAEGLRIDRFRLVGMSVGGPYALACAAQHPAHVESVTVVGAAAPHRAVMAVTCEEAVEHFRPEFEQFVASIDPADPDDQALAQRWLLAMSAYDRDAVIGLSTAQLAQSAREALLDPRGYLCDAATTFRPWAFDPADVQCPTHLWYGDADKYAADGQALQRQIPGARLTVLPATGHLPALTQHWDEILGLRSPA